MEVKREIAVQACHLFHRLKGMAKMDVDGPGQQTLLHLHGLMEGDLRRWIILGDLAVPRASRSSINIGGSKTDRQRSDLRDRPKRLGTGGPAIIMLEISDQRKDGFRRPCDEGGKVQIGHTFTFLISHRLVEAELYRQ